jgi:uncharacterized phage protein (TIGR02218 family)
MSYQARETSTYSGQPYELFQFTTIAGTWRFTGADEPKVYQGVTFDPEAIIHTEPSAGAELKSGTIKITLPADNEIAAQFIPYMPQSPMFLTIFRAHDGEADSETVVYWTGKITAALFGDVCELTATPEQGVLKRSIPQARFQMQCNHILFDGGCKVIKDLFKVLGTLTSVAGAVIQAVAFGTKPDGYFNGGYIEFGNQRRLIVNHVGTTLTLLEGLPGLSVASVCYAYAGCNHNFTGDCTTKFANTGNFFGFQWIPSKNPFNGGLQ